MSGGLGRGLGVWVWVWVWGEIGGTSVYRGDTWSSLGRCLLFGTGRSGSPVSVVVMVAVALRE